MIRLARFLLAVVVVIGLGGCADEPLLQSQPEIGPSLDLADAAAVGLNFQRVIVDPNSPVDPYMKNIARLDGDGLPDLVVSAAQGPVIWYQAPGWTKRTIGTASSQSGSATGDLDGDGDVDVVVGKTWFQNGGGGTSWTTRQLPGGSAGTHDVLIADVNADGRPDIIMRGESATVVTVYLQNSPTSWTTFDVEPGIGLNGLDVADMNADGRPDIVVGGVWMKNPGGNVASASWARFTFAPGWNAYASVKVIDIDEDGRVDVVLSVSEEVGKLSWFKGPANPEGGSWSERVIDTGLHKVHCFAVEDVNADGALDVIASEFEGTGRLIIYLNGGSTWAATELGRDSLHNMRAGDIDADGDIDFFGVYCFGVRPVVLYRNTGGGTPPSAPPTVATGASASPSTVTGVTTALSVRGADDGGEPSLRYGWSTSGSPPAPVEFLPNGSNAARNTTATFSRAGTYQLVATITDAQGQSVTSAVTVTVAHTLTTIAISPSSATVAPGATQAFSATGQDQFAHPMGSSPASTWTASGGGTINGSGVFTAGGATGGPFTVTATAGGRSGTAAITVAGGGGGGGGGTSTFGEASILGTDDGNNGGLLVAQQATLGQAGTVQSMSFYVTVPAGTLRLGIYDATGPGGGPGAKRAETAEITPVAGWNTAPVVTPVALPAGSYWLAYLSSTNALRFRMTTNGSGRWYSVSYGPMPATYSTSPSSGAYHWSLYATLSGGSAPGNQPPTIATGATASPSSVTGTSTALSVLGADDAGEPALRYTWATAGTPPGAVSFSPNGSNAARNSTASFSRSGTYQLVATVTDAQGSSTTSGVTVTVAQTLTSVAVTPATASVATGASQAFGAAARDQFGQPMASAPSFGWTVSGGGSVSGSGVFTAGGSAGGPFTVTASTGGKAGVASVTVIGGGGGGGTTVLGESAILPTDDGNNGGLLVAQQATLAQAGTIQSLSFYVTVPAGVLRLGVYDATGPGGGPGAKRAETAEISPVAGWNTAPVLNQVALAPGTYWLAYLSSTNSLRFRMTTNGNGRWYSAGYGAMPTTYSTSPSAGAYHWSLYATLGSGAAPPTNQAPTVAQGAAASPASVTGATTAVSALGADDGGEPALRYTWATAGSPPAAVGFAPNGSNAARSSTATFSRAGTYQLSVTIADAQGLSVTSGLTVTVGQTLTALIVTPGTATVAAGSGQAFSATGRDQFGQPMSSPAAAWSVSGGGTISSSGQFTAGGSAGGPHTVTASAGGRSGTASVTVSGGGGGGGGGGPTSTLGEPNLLPNHDGNNGGLLVAQQATLGQPGTVESLSFYVGTPAGRLRLGIYDATGPGGGPGVKRAETAEFTPVAGWNTVPVAAQVALPAGNYWLAYLTDTDALKFRMATSGNGRWYPVSFGAMPTTYSASAPGGGYHWSFYATVRH